MEKKSLKRTHGEAFRLSPSFNEKKKTDVQTTNDILSRIMARMVIAGGCYKDTDGFVHSELFKIVTASMDDRHSESVILFSNELLLEIGVNNRGVRRAIETLGRTSGGQIEDSDDMIFATKDDMGRTILNPLTFRSDERFCAVAEPLEALEALYVVLPVDVGSRLKEFVRLLSKKCY